MFPRYFPLSFTVPRPIKVVLRLQSKTLWRTSSLSLSLVVPSACLLASDSQRTAAVASLLWWALPILFLPAASGFFYNADQSQTQPYDALFWKRKSVVIVRKRAEWPLPSWAGGRAGWDEGLRSFKSKTAEAACLCHLCPRWGSHNAASSLSAFFVLPLCSPPFHSITLFFFFFIVTNSHPSSNSLFWFFNSVRRESEQDSKTGSQWDGRGWLWTFEGQGGGRNNAFCPLDGNHRGHNRSFQTSRRCWIHQFGLKMENHTPFILYKY